MSGLDKRAELLLKMYDQMFNDIDCHIKVVWQSIGAVIGAFALFSLVDKDIIPYDICISLILILSGWLIGHLYDASYWYNRNLCIIANIERDFLNEEDLKNIHYYFGKHRSVNSMLTHLRIQYYLGVAIALVVLGYHISITFLPDEFPGRKLCLMNFLPYITLIGVVLFLRWIRNNRNDAYQEFLKNSPGKVIATTGVVYGAGHGQKVSKKIS